MGFQNLTPRFQDLEPIKRPLTASFISNIRKTLKMGIKLKEKPLTQGETPNSRSLRKLPISGTHTKPSPRRGVLPLVSKTADGWICQKSREKSDTLSLESPFLTYYKLPSLISRFCLGLMKEKSPRHYFGIL